MSSRFAPRAAARLAALLTGALALDAAAQVGIGPPYYDLAAAEAARTHAFRIYNYTADDIDFVVTAAPWDMSADAAVQLLPTTATSIDQFTVVNPLKATVKAGASQAIRFSVRPAIALPPGEHRVMLVIDEVAKPVADDEKTKVRSRFQFRSAVYVQSGKPKRTATVGEVAADANGYRIALTATGTANTRFAGQHVLWRRAKFPGAGKTPEIANLGRPEAVLPDGAVAAGKMPTDPVLPNHARTLSYAYEAPLEPGEYTLDFKGTLGDEPFARSVELTAAAPKPK